TAPIASSFTGGHSWAGGRPCLHEAPRVHHAARRSGRGVAARGASAARADAPDRRADDTYGERSRSSGLGNSAQRGASKVRLGAGSQCPYRLPLVGFNRKQILALAGHHRIPAIYPFRFFVRDGGLISYGSDPLDLWRRSASYVDRIIRGENAGDLPVQAATKFELGINLKTAQAR